ncbi:MAG: hypothetical protein QOD77_1745 [Thermoplasmata archaeon]|jgi:hypothetical protein|nr:hypothetical protein [Thermoplasmata archaeon]
MIRALVPIVAALLLAGCVGGNAITISGQGFTQGDQSRTLACGTAATVAFGIQGAGSLQVRVLDGAGHEVFEQAVAFGQDGGIESLKGQEGTWKLVVATPAMYGGQYSITLTC